MYLFFFRFMSNDDFDMDDEDIDVDDYVPPMEMSENEQPRKVLINFIDNTMLTSPIRW